MLFLKLNNSSCVGLVLQSNKLHFLDLLNFLLHSLPLARNFQGFIHFAEKFALTTPVDLSPCSVLVMRDFRLAIVSSGLTVGHFKRWGFVAVLFSPLAVGGVKTRGGLAVFLSAMSSGVGTMPPEKVHRPPAPLPEAPSNAEKIIL